MSKQNEFDKGFAYRQIGANSFSVVVQSEKPVGLTLFGPGPTGFGPLITESNLIWIWGLATLEIKMSQ